MSETTLATPSPRLVETTQNARPNPTPNHHHTHAPNTKTAPTTGLAATGRAASRVSTCPVSSRRSDNTPASPAVEQLVDQLVVSPSVPSASLGFSEPGKTDTPAPLMSPTVSQSGGWGAVWVALAWLGVKILAIAGVVVLVFTMVFVLVRVSDETMMPALAGGDTAIVYRLGGDYALGDVVALDYEGQRQLRRVVAGGGDTVDITADGLEVNGAIQYEPRIVGETLAINGGISLPVTLSEDEVFVLADSRESGGTDSRVYGPVKTADTLGKVITLVRRTNI